MKSTDYDCFEGGKKSRRPTVSLLCLPVSSDLFTAGKPTANNSVFVRVNNNSIAWW
jgi:hypothetical protein